MLKGFVLALALLAAVPVRAADTDALYRALEGGDNAAMYAYVEDHYREAGASLNDRLAWKPLPFDDVVNWYAHYEITISLAVFPTTADEVDRYWDNWATILTVDAWGWRGFFHDGAEAALMANYNQFVLAAHEYGHALTYRYDWWHTDRTGFEINCREYFADRLAAGLIEELAESDERFAALRERYRELMAAINGLVPAESRYATPSFAALDADCAIMHVVQPTAETMTPYASAFFVRQGLLHAEDLPPLAEMYERYLFPRLAATRPPASGYAGAVTTLEVLNGVSGLSTPSRLPSNNRHFAFAPDGELYVGDVSLDYESEPPRIRFAYGPAGGTIEEAVPVRPVEGIAWDENELLLLNSVLSLGPDRFLVMSSANGFGGVRSLLVDVRRVPGGDWYLRIVDLDLVDHNFLYSRIVRGPDGGIHLYEQEYVPESADYATQWFIRELDPETLEVVDTRTVPSEGTPELLALGPRGETYYVEEAGLVVVPAGGTKLAYAGPGLEGSKDNDDPLLAEFILPMSIWLDPAGGMRVLDYANGMPAIRHIAAGAAIQETAEPAVEPERAPPPKPLRPNRMGW